MSDPTVTRESISQEALEVVIQEHAIHGVTSVTFDGLNKAIIGLTEFFLKVTDTSDPIPYQYKKENQKDFEKYQVIISSALDKVEPVISDMNQRMYILEKNQTQIVMPNMPEPISIPTPEPEKKGASRLFSRTPKTPPPNPNDPYQSIQEVRNKMYELIKMWQLVVEWQSEGVEYFDDFTRLAYDEYLSTHIVIFRHEVAPNLLRIYSQGLRLILTKEKELAERIATSMQKEAFQTRQDFPIPPK